MAEDIIEEAEAVYEDITINIEDKPILKEALQAFLELLGELKICAEKKHPYDSRRMMNDMIVKYEVFARRFPLVLQHMCQHQQFSPKIFAKFMNTVRENAEKSKNEREMLKMQAHYEVEYIKVQYAEELKTGVMTKKDLDKAYNDIKNMYFEQLEKRNEDHKQIKDDFEKIQEDVKVILIATIKAELEKSNDLFAS